MSKKIEERKRNTENSIAKSPEAMRKEQVIEIVKSMLSLLKESYGVELWDIEGVYAKKAEDAVLQMPEQIQVPVQIFSYNLAPAEALCKYLKEEKSLTLHQIGELLNRDERGLWTIYKRAVKKQGQRFKITSRLSIPVFVFKDRSLSLLKNLILYLNQTLKLKNYDIAKFLNKKPGQVAVTLRRAIREKKKQNKEQGKGNDTAK